MTPLNEISSRLYALDGLRGVAALIVVERHCRHWFDDWSFSSGYLAVDFFFLLSGFVLARAYDHKLAEGFSKRRFIGVRFLRSFPLYAIGVALTSWIMALEGELYISDLILALLFMPRFSLSNPNWLVGPGWSLSMELLVNGAYAWHRNHLSDKVLRIIVLFSAIALFIVAFYYGSLDVGYEISSLNGGFARVIFSFFLGVILCRSLRFLPRFPRGGWAAVTLFLGLLSISVSAEWRPLCDTIIVVAGMPVVMILAAHSVPNPASRWYFEMLGEMSYALYAIHWGAIKITDHYWQAAFGSQTHPTGILGLCFIAAFTVTSIALARFVDVPFRKAVQTTMKARLT